MHRPDLWIASCPVVVIVLDPPNVSESPALVTSGFALNPPQKAEGDLAP